MSDGLIAFIDGALAFAIGVSILNIGISAVLALADGARWLSREWSKRR